MRPYLPWRLIRRKLVKMSRGSEFVHQTAQVGIVIGKMMTSEVGDCCFFG